MSAPHASSPPTPQRPADRYGTVTHPTARRAGLVILGLLLAAALAWWVWIAAMRSNPDVRWDLQGYEVVSDTSIELTWVVDRPPGVALDCVLRARDESGAEVGRNRVPVPAGDTESNTVQHTLVTTARAVNGEVLTCLEIPA